MRCWTRVGHLGFDCKCGYTFCSKHRHFFDHSCTYDFKAEGKVRIARANPVVQLPKIDKV